MHKVADKYKNVGIKRQMKMCIDILQQMVKHNDKKIKLVGVDKLWETIFYTLDHVIMF